MKLKLKTIGQQLLHHHPHLLQAWLTLDVGLGLHIILIGVQPGWSFRDLPGRDFIRELDEVGERHIVGDELAAAGWMDGKVRSLLGRLDRGYFKCRIGILWYPLRRGRWWGNFPCRLRRGVHQDQRKRLQSLRPGTGDRFAVVAQLSLERSTDH